MERKHIDINGVSFTIADKEFVEKYKNIIAGRIETTILSDNQILLNHPLTMKQLIQAAGHDMNKIDFAVPQDWLNRPENKERFYDENDRAVWSYENNSIFGHPVFASEAKEKMMDNIIETIQNENPTPAIMVL